MDTAVRPYAFNRETKMTKNTVIHGRSFRLDSAGFTVVELVVLVAVIGILSAIGFPLYLSYSRAQETDSAETQTNPNNRMRFCSGTVVPCPGGSVFTGPETDGNGWRTLENGSRITAGPTITFSSLGAATASGVLRVQNSSATGSLDVCVSPSGRIKVQAVGTACP